MAVSRIGIDLGPTCARAAWVDGDQCVLLETLTGHRFIPSVVGLDREGALHVGDSARCQLLLWPERSASNLRRHLGTSQRLELDRKRFSATELCAVVLSQLKELSEERLGHSVQAATIAVPCHFAPEQHQAMIDAARLAGFRGAQTVLEPLSIARAYGLKPSELPDDKAILICDIGAFHIEVTLLSQKSGRFAVLSTAQCPTGSDLIDERLADHLGRAFQSEHGLSVWPHRKTLARLRLAAEWAKCQLSEREPVTVRLPGLITLVDTPVDLVAELTSEQLALLVEDELRKSLEVIEIALRSARIKSSQLHAVLLSGGGARLPLLADLVASCAVLRPVTMAAPEEMIARGAALLSTQS